jgi:hypothetical protein
VDQPAGLPVRKLQVVDDQNQGFRGQVEGRHHRIEDP